MFSVQPAGSIAARLSKQRAGHPTVSSTPFKLSLSPCSSKEVEITIDEQDMEPVGNERPSKQEVQVIQDSQPLDETQEDVESPPVG